jgi:hypothetical protein
MKRVDFTKEMVEDAVKIAHQMGPLNNSITSGRGNAAGTLAEIALAKYLFIHTFNTWTSDFNYKEKRVEVKTKRRTVDPRPYYEVSVAETSTHQRPDIYAFLSITFRKRVGSGVKAVYYGLKDIWLCGFCSKKFFYDNATFYREGEVDSSNGFIVKENMFNLPIEKLEISLDKVADSL